MSTNRKEAAIAAWLSIEHQVALEDSGASALKRESATSGYAAQHEVAVARSYANIEQGKMPNTAILNDELEVRVRDYLLKRGVRPEDIRVHKKGRVDVRRKSASGGWTRIEVKAGGSSFAYQTADVDAVAENPDAYFAACDLVVYCHDTKAAANDFEHNMLVYTRAEFIAMLADTRKNGMRGALKRNVARKAVNIQSWNGAAPARLAAWVFENDIPCLEDWSCENT